MLDVAPQVECENKTCKQIITFMFQALKTGAISRVLRDKITEQHRGVDVVFRLCKYGIQPAPPYLEGMILRIAFVPHKPVKLR